MPPKKSKNSKKTKKNKKEDQENAWRNHDLYSPGVSFNRIVTRSQVAFNKIKKSDSNLDLFADGSKYQPPGQPNLMEVMKGKYGAIPRTIITRSTAERIQVSEGLSNMLNVYKSYSPDPYGTPDDDELQVIEGEKTS